MAVILEIVNRANRVLNRYTFDQTTVTIGRGYDNDLVLADPYVCSHHARIGLKQAEDDASTTWQIEDRDSINGVIVGKHQHLQGQGELNSGDKFTVGRTHLRILSSDHPVAPALTMTPTELLFMTLSRPSWLIALVLITLGLTALSQYLASYARIKPADFSLTLLSVAIMVSLWPGFCALLGRVFRSEPRYLIHLAATLLYATLSIVVGGVINTIEFNIQQTWLFSTISYLCYGLLAVALIAVNLRFATHQTARNRQLIAHGITWSIVGISLLSSYAGQPDYQASPRYNSVLLPQALLFHDPVEVESFLDQSEHIFEVPVQP